MKMLMTLFALFSASIANTQYSKLKGTWITPDQELILIEDIDAGYGQNHLANALLREDNLLGLTISGNTLIFHPQNHSWKRGDSTFWYRYDLQEFSIDKSIRFQKIVFHTSYCFGSCNVFHLEMDSAGCFKLDAERVFKEAYDDDSARMGNFTGKVHDTLYNNFTRELQTSNLRTLQMKSIHCCDGVIYTIIIYFNGTRKYLS